MESSKIYLFSESNNNQIDYLAELIEKRGIQTKSINLHNSKERITITEESIIINEEEINTPTLFYSHYLRPDYLTVPEMESNFNRTAFADLHPSLEQKRSHLLSLISIANRLDNIVVINNSLDFFNLVSPYFYLYKLVEIGFNVPSFIITNNLEELNNTDIIKNSDSLLWTYPFINSPINSISINIVNKLFETTNELPFLFFKSIPGREIRIWFYKSVPLLGAFTKYPNAETNPEDLETFNFIYPDELMQEYCNKLRTLPLSDFFELRAILDTNANLWVYSIDCDPDFMFLGKEGRDFLSNQLINHFFKELEIDEIQIPELITSENRDTIFLRRLNYTLSQISANVGK